MLTPTLFLILLTFPIVDAECLLPRLRGRWSRLRETKLRVGYIFRESRAQQLKEQVFINTKKIVYKKFTVDKLLAEESPEIDILLHKLSYDLVDPKLKPKMDQLKEYLHEHEDIKVVDPIASVELLSNRTTTRSVMIGAHLRVPKAFELERGVSEDEIEELLVRNEMNLPVICKPVSFSKTDSHQHVLIAKLEDFQQHLVEGRRYVIEAFINHNGRLLKVYNVGDRIFVIPRASISDISADEEAIAFDSQKPFPKLYKGEIPNTGFRESRMLERVARTLRSSFDMSLFGFDIIRDAKTSKYYVVDMNYFPTFKSVQNLDQLFETHLLDQKYDDLSRLAEQLFNNPLTP